MPILAWDSPAPRRKSGRAPKIAPALLDARWLDHLLDAIGAQPPITQDDLEALRRVLRHYSAEVVRAAQFALHARAASERAIERANAVRFATARKLRARARSAMTERLRQGRTRRVIVRELAKEMRRTGKTISAWTRDIGKGSA